MEGDSGLPRRACAKQPRTRNGFKNATLELQQVRRWWWAWPDANIGVPAGAVSGWVVIDADDRDALHELERQCGALPLTFSVATPRGGLHLYFRHPGVAVRPTVGQLAPGVDVRGDGAYTLVPPSRVNGIAYAVEEAAPLAELPGWLRQRLIVPSVEAKRARPASEWAELVAEGVEEGRRDDQTAALAGYMIARRVALPVVVALLIAWDEARNRPPQGRANVEDTVRSVARCELRKLGVAA